MQMGPHCLSRKVTGGKESLEGQGGAGIHRETAPHCSS